MLKELFKNDGIYWCHDDILDLVEVEQILACLGQKINLNELYDKVEDKLDLLHKINVLEKALDKACNELEKWDINNFEGVTVTKDQWKEWCINDE